MNRQTKIKPTAIDLFSGCGGLTLGLKQADFRVVGAVEVDPISIETYKQNHPEVIVWDADIRELAPEIILDQLGIAQGEIDLLAGCPPCQGFSTMTTRNGSRNIDDPRNDLIFDFLRFVYKVRPKAIMLENVPGLLTDHRMNKFMSEIQSLGYKGTPRILNLADYGIPQRRRRLVLLAGLGKEIKYAAPSGYRATVRETIGKLPKPGASGDPIHDHGEKRTPKIKRLISLIPKNGGSRKDLPDKEQLACHLRTDGFKDVYGRMKWDDVAPTITSGCFNPSKGRFLHPEEDRAITLREAALLQGFPPGYQFLSYSNKSDVARLIGNAFPPPMAYLQAREIQSSIQLT